MVTGGGLALAGLALVGGATGLWFQRTRQVRLPANRSGFVAAWLGGTVLGAAGLASGTGWLGGLAGGVAVVGGLLLTGLVAVSRQRVGAGAVRVGDDLPDFEAPDEHGEPFRLSSLADHPVLLKFFRGHW